MSFGLVLGGGGVVGLAWEVGVLAGLAEVGVFYAAYKCEDSNTAITILV